MVRFMQSHGLGHLRSFGHEPLLHRSYDERRLRSPRYHRAGVYPRGYHYDDQLYSGGSLCHDCSNGMAYAGCNDPHCSQYEDDWYYNRVNTGYVYLALIYTKQTCLSNQTRYMAVPRRLRRLYWPSWWAFSFFT